MEDPDLSTLAARLTHLLWLAREADDPRTGTLPLHIFADLSGVAVDTLRAILAGEHKRGAQPGTLAKIARAVVHAVKVYDREKAEGAIVTWLAAAQGDVPTREKVRAGIAAAVRRAGRIGGQRSAAKRAREAT